MEPKSREYELHLQITPSMCNVTIYNRYVIS